MQRTTNASFSVLPPLGGRRFGWSTTEGGVAGMGEPNYWTRWAKRRLSRRRLLKGAAGVGAGLAVASVVGCGGGDEGPAATPGPRGTPAGGGAGPGGTGTP